MRTFPSWLKTPPCPGRSSQTSRERQSVLFCDRLQLSELLTQLGLAEAEGTGSLSGLIPLTYSNRQILVDNGFLFSTPGEQGRLKIKDSPQLTAGIPVNVPQFSPLHFAGAALKDFEYNWAKLAIFSEDDNLMLQLKIDGKPSEPLPYRYDVKNNVFVRIDEGADGLLHFVGVAKQGRQLVAEENKDRRTVYQAIAKKERTSPATVGQRRAMQIASRARPGRMLQKPDGTWYKK